MGRILLVLVLISVGLWIYRDYKKSVYVPQDIPLDIDESSLYDSPPFPEVSLEDAVRAGDAEEVKKWIQEGVHVAYWNWKSARGKGWGIPPEKVKPEIAKLLVEAGANPDDFVNGWSYSQSTPVQRKKALKKKMLGLKAEDKNDYVTAEKMYLEALKLDPYLDVKRELKHVQDRLLQSNGATK